MSETASRLLVWLEWPEECFRLGEKSLAVLRDLAGGAHEIAVAHGEEEFLALLGEATHIITWHFKEEWYRLAPRLKVLATPAAGRELVAWRKAPEGVKVHFGSFHGAIISETVAAFMAAWARGFFFKPPEGGIWPREWLSGKCRLLAGTRGVIAGYGRIGKAIGARLAALGIDVQGFSRANLDGMEDAMRNADWFILALPSDTGTDDFLSRDRIALLPPRAVVINIGRGNAIDEDALEDALRSGRIAGAYLDVFKREPTQINDGKAPADGLWAKGIANLVAMPHSSAFAPEYLPLAFKELKNEGLI